MNPHQQNSQQEKKLKKLHERGKKWTIEHLCIFLYNSIQFPFKSFKNFKLTTYSIQMPFSTISHGSTSPKIIVTNALYPLIYVAFNCAAFNFIYFILFYFIFSIFIQIFGFVVSLLAVWWQFSINYGFCCCCCYIIISVYFFAFM